MGPRLRGDDELGLERATILNVSVGQISCRAQNLSIPVCENNPLGGAVDSPLQLPPSRPLEGAYHDRRERGTGRGGRGSAGRVLYARRTATCPAKPLGEAGRVADGKIVWS